MIDLIRQMLQGVVSVEEQHGTGRVRHLLVTTSDGVARPCVLRRAPRRELALHRSCLTAAATGAPALLGYALRGPEAYLLLEALPEQFPDFAAAADVARCYRHLAALHQVPHNSLKQRSPWAITAAGAVRILGALPETARFAAQASLLQTGPPTLIHGDYHRWNLVLAADQVRVLDWEHAGLADPIWDLALLAPEEPGWDGVPRGALARHALQIYHEAGPLARLTWPEFVYRQRLARLVVAARWTLVHRAKARRQPPGGPRDQILAYADQQHTRARALSALLTGA